MNYGGRGITVCDRWVGSFELFLSDMWRKPQQDYTIDRIDNNLGYFPGNCRWADKSTQAKNRRPRQRLNNGQFAPKTIIEDGEVAE